MQIAQLLMEWRIFYVKFNMVRPLFAFVYSEFSKFGLIMNQYLQFILTATEHMRSSPLTLVYSRKIPLDALTSCYSHPSPTPSLFFLLSQMCRVGIDLTNLTKSQRFTVVIIGIYLLIKTFLFVFLKMFGFFLSIFSWSLCPTDFSCMILPSARKHNYSINGKR